MDSWNIFGHDAIKRILGRQLDSGRLPHAYLFAGPDGLGKKALALEFAKKILKTDSLGNHPDFELLDGAEEITMETVVGLIGRLSGKPFTGPRRVAIINNAENLNHQSANALLKTLEEPPPSALIILVAGSGRLLPTIVSRCQVLRFSAFGRQKLKSLAKQAEWQASDEQISLSFGRPVRLKRFIDDAGFWQAEKENILAWQKLSIRPLGEKLLAITELAEQETADLKNRLLNWLNWEAAHLNLEPQGFLKVRALLEARLALDMNKNKKLVLQKLLLQI